MIKWIIEIGDKMEITELVTMYQSFENKATELWGLL